MIKRARGRRSRRARQPAVAAVLCLFVCVLFVPSVCLATRTVVTKYTYNADGALTAVAKTDGGNVDTTYVTWDDFVPDAVDPTTGTVRSGDGNLVGFGSNPGAAQFEFDARDRLTAYHSDSGDETYSYLADGTMATSSAGGDDLRFYYDNSQNARVTNIHQEGPDLWSAYLPGARYLSDGSQQILVQPRKDMACTYDAQAQTLRSYTYDAFGSQPHAQLRSTYDLHDNPFQYAGEYRDPIWGGVYLRARWYNPDLPIFMSRDPAANLNRYGYAGGNPVMNVDPSGMNFWHDLRIANTFMNKGIGGHFARIFLSPLMGVLSIAADPKGFWESIKHDRDGIDIFLAAGVATEIASAGLEGFGLSAFVRNLTLRTRFATRLVIDSGLAIGQAVAAGADRGFHHFNWNSFAQNVELVGGGLVYSRGLVGEGYNPYTLKGEDVARMVGQAKPTKILIFRERTQGYRPWAPTSPLTERLKVSAYHERIIAVSRDHTMLSEVVVDTDTNIGFRRFSSKGVSAGTGTAIDLKNFLGSRSSRFQFVGEADAAGRSFARKFMRSNPINFPSEQEFKYRAAAPQLLAGKAEYHLLRNNCHYHAQAVLKDLGF
jgi:RHS repeat-associated protein